MKTSLFSFQKIVLSAMLLLISTAGWGQYSITGTGSGNTYTQDFDAFRGTAATLPINWAVSSASYNTTYPILTAGAATPTVANANANNCYAGRASASSSDYSVLQKQATSGPATTFTFSATNNTGGVINGFVLTWNVEQLSAAGRATTVDFKYRLNGGTYVNTGITGTTLYTSSTGTSTTFSYVNSTPTGYSITITGLSLAASGTVDFQFSIANGSGSGSNAHVGIDDFTIYATSSPSCTTPATPSGTFSGATTGCGSVPIVFTGAIPSGESYYWQSSATGTATTYPVTSGDTFLAPSSGTWYVRSQVASCWSAAQTGPTVTVSPAVSIGMQPNGQTVIAGNNVSFSVAATNATGYQWQVNTGTGFSNLSNGGVYSNTSTSTLNITGATVGMNGYQYRCVISANAPCAEANSNTAILTVNSPTVNTIPNQNNVYGSAVNITTTATGAVSSWTATLPAGLSINTSTGLISGTLTEDVVNSPFASSVTANFVAGGADTKNFTWTISQRPLSVSGLTGTNKIYDGNTAATVGGTATLNNKVGSDDVSLSGTPVGTFVSKDVANGININISGYSLSGTKAGNYTLTTPTTTANITKKALTITAPSIATKVYNGLTTSGLVTPGTLSDLIGTETLNISAAGTYADANAGTGKTATITYALANGGNGGLANNYSLANGTGIGDITKASLTATADNKTKTLNTANPTLTITYTGFVNSETTATAAGFTAPSASTTAVTNSPVGTYPITLSGGSATNYNFTLVNGTLTVALVSYQNGDFRTIAGYSGSVYFNSATPWEVYNGSIWQSTTYSPQTATWTPENIYVNDGTYIDFAGGKQYNNIIINVPNITVYSGNTTTGITISAGKTMDVKSGNFSNAGKLTMEANSKLIIRDGASVEFSNVSYNLSRNATSTFEVENNGYVFVNTYNPNLWTGNEIFHEESYFEISKWDKDNRLFTNASDISDYSYNGVSAKFGYLDINIGSGAISGNWSYVFPNENFNLTHKDFDVVNNSSDNISLNPGTMGIGGNFNIDGSGNIQGREQSGAKVINIKGNFSKKGTGEFRLNTASDATTSVVLNVVKDFTVEKGSFVLDNGATTNLTSEVNLGGNLTKSSDSYMTNSNTKSTNTRFNFVGNATSAPQLVDVNVKASNDMLRYYFYIKPTAYVQLAVQDWKLATNSSITVENGGTLDFGFNGNNPLNVAINNNQQQMTFNASAGSTLKITSPFGITKSTSNPGNVQIPIAGRTFNPAATYHYIGKANAAQVSVSGVDQVSGNGLPSDASAKNVIVELATSNSTQDDVSFKALGINKFTSAGALKIIKGKVIDEPGNGFADGNAEDGSLIMTGGWYKISRGGTQPSLGGPYNLTGGAIEFAGSSAIDARAGNPAKEFLNVVVSGSNVTAGTTDAAGLTFKPSGSFTVKNGGVFKVNNPNGFSDGASTAIKNTNAPKISLESGSTINYSRNGDQIITNAALDLPVNAHYQNLTISGSGEKKIAPGKEVIVNNLTKVDAATLKVEESADSIAPAVLTAKKGLQVATAANALFQNNAQLMQDADASNSGEITMNRIFTLSSDFVGSNGQTIPERSQYNFIISPVTDQKIKSIYPGGVLAPFVIKYAEDADWFVNAGDGDYVPGKAYAIKEPTKKDFAATSVITEFKGSPANGDAISYTLQYGSAPNHINGMDNKGWNLVGNPYPSNLDIEQLYDANDSKIETTFQFWDNRGNIYTTQLGSNYVGHNYAYYNALNGTGVGSGGKADDATGEVREPTKDVKVGTGFMVRAKENSPNGRNLEFKNAYRLTTSGPGFFGKGTEKTNVKDRFWLEIATPDELKFMTAMVYFEKGKYEFGIDDTESPEGSDDIYSMVDEHTLVIQGRPLFEDTDVVPLGVNAFKDGNYSIGVYKKEGVFEAGQSIYLRDKHTGIVTDISNDGYTFSANAGSTIGRFEILYRPGAVLGTSNSTENGIYIYRDANAFVIRSSQKLLEYADLYDISGRMLHRQHAKNSKEMRVEADKLADGIYLLKIRTQSGEELTKKVRK